MLEYAGGPGRAALRMLIKHDDAEREFDYVGGSEQALDRAAADGVDRRQREERLGHGLRAGAGDGG